MSCRGTSCKHLMTARPSFPKRIALATKSSMAYLCGLAKDGPSGLDVRRFEWFADCAEKLIKDLEFGCSLRQYTFSNPFTRQLLEGKTLRYEMQQGTRLCEFYTSPISFEDRGLEAALSYEYKNCRMPEKSFGLALMLRLSESTDIIGNAIKCLHPLTCQFKAVAEYAMGELTLLPDLQDISHSYTPPAIIQDSYTEITHLFRPDPLCCNAYGQRPSANNVILSELSHEFPEQVIGFSLISGISSLEFSLTDEASRNVEGDRPPPMEFGFGFAPHLLLEGVKENFALEITGGKEEHKNGASIQETCEMVRTKVDCFAQQPELADYSMHWFSKHGKAVFTLRRPSTERACAPRNNRRSKIRRAGNRRHV